MKVRLTSAERAPTPAVLEPVLPDGKVLITGGSDSSSAAEIYDPATGTFVLTGSMSVSRMVHTTTLLKNGKVLITGGQNNVNIFNTAELYDPATGTFTDTGNMNDQRFMHRATLLPNGEVLITGGYNGSLTLGSAELFNQGSVNLRIIKLPRTGQTRCWNSSGSEISCAGTGQDGDIQAGVAWPDPRFSVNGDCVTDNLTGLMWAQNGNLGNGPRTWSYAIDYASSLTLCGYSDWRLPNVTELQSLVNAGEPDGASWLNAQGFSNVQSQGHWSSTTRASYTVHAWDTYKWEGQLSADDKGNAIDYVWAVRAVSTPPSQLWKTGQTTIYRTGDDGDLEAGVAWPSSRFFW